MHWQQGNLQLGAKWFDPWILDRVSPPTAMSSMLAIRRAVIGAGKIHHWTSYIWHWHMEAIFFMEETWQYVSVNWIQGRWLLWNPLLSTECDHSSHGPLARYVKLWVLHALGMPGKFSPTPRVSNPYMHRGTCVTHVPSCMLGSLTRRFALKSVAGKTLPAFQAHAQPAILRIW